MGKPLTDYDNPWKEALERYFPEFMTFFLADAAADIDWRRKYEFLDKELRQVTREAEVGARRVDHLVRVHRQGGQETWVLVHVEVQGQPEPDFAERMYVYNYRLYDRHHRQVVSLAVLADETALWRPTGFGYALWGCEVGIKFPVIKLLDYRARWDELEASRNPFAVIVMAHLKSLETRQNDDARLAAKVWLTKRLYQRGYERQDIINLFRFIDWVIQLPEGLDQIFWREVAEIEEAQQMPYITSVERIGMQKGLEQGIQQGIQQGTQQGMQQGQAQMVLHVLSRRFDTVPVDLAGAIRDLPSAHLTALLDVALSAEALPEVAAFVKALAAGDGKGNPSRM
jgi:hypothetical protein